MANADGSIIIDTQLDNSGFKSGSNQLRSAITGLQSTVTTFGQQAQSSINSIAPALQNVARQAQYLSNAMPESQFQKNLGSMASSVETLQGKITSLQQRAEQGFSTEAQAAKWQSDYEKIQDELSRVKDRILEIGQTQVKSESYTQLESEAAKLEAQLEKLYDRQALLSDMGVDENSSSWKRLSIEIDNVEAKLTDVQADMQSMESNGTAFAQGNQTGAYSQLFSKADQAINSLNSLSEKELEVSSNSQQASSAVSGFSSLLQSIGSNSATIARAGVSGFSSAISALGSGIITAFSSALSGAKTLITGFTSALTTMGSTALTSASYLAKLPFKAISTGANVAKKALSSFTNKTSSTTLSSNTLVKSLTSLKRMLVTRVKRLFISSVFNQVKSSLQNIAKVSSEFNTSMSNIKNSAKTMSGNVAVSFSNLLNAIEPTITSIINWLSTAISYLNSFFALLSGKTSVQVAKKSTDDYAKSLSNASSAASDLNHQVYGFDELTKQDSSSGGSGGSSGASYEWQDIDDLLPDSIADLFNSIKDAIASENWEEVGSLIASGLNIVITKVDDWINNTLRPEGVKWAGNIASILNGLVDDLDFDSLGDLFGDGLNAIVDIGYTFLTTFNWSRLGEQLATGVNSIFDSVDWDLLGSFFAAKWNAIINTASTFFQNLDWSLIGSSFSTGLNTFVNSINWSGLSSSIISGLNGITTSIKTFITTFDWDNLATQFKDGVNSIISNVNWTNLIITVVLGFYLIERTFYSAISKINWTELASKLADGVNKIFGSGNEGLDWSTLSQNVSNSINGVIDGIKTFIEKVDWDQMAQSFANGINSIVTGVNWSTLVWTIVVGMLKIATTLFTTLAAFDWESLATSFADGINEIFGIDENGNPNIDFANLGTKIGEAINNLVSGIRTTIESIDWASMAETCADGINSLIKTTDWDGLLSTASQIFIDLGTTMLDAVANIDFEGIGTTIANSINGLFKDDAGNLDTTKLQELGNSLSDAFKSVFEGVSSFVENIDLDAILQGILDFVSSIDWTSVITSIITLIAQALVKAVDALPDLVQGIVDLIGKIDWLDVGKAIISGIAGVLVSAVEAVGGVIATLWDAIFSSSEEVEVPQVLSESVKQQLMDQMSEVGKQMASTLTNTLVESLSDAGSDYEAAKTLFLTSAALIGQGFQDEFESTMKEWNISDETTASLAQQSKDLFEAIKAPDATVNSIKEQFKQSGIWITDGLAEALKGEGSENVGAALQLLALGVEQDTISALDMTNLNANLTSYMNETGKSLEEVAGELATQTGDTMGRLMPEGMIQGYEEGKAELESKADELENLASTKDSRDVITDEASTTGEEVDTNLATGIDSNKATVNESAEAVKDEIVDPLSQLPDDVKPYAEALMTSITQAIANGDPVAVAAIEAAAQAVVNKAAEIMSLSAGEEITKAFIDGWNNGIVYNYSPIITNVAEIGANIVSEAEAHLNDSNGETIGGNMVIGMINGFKNYGQTLVDTMATICSTCTQTAREILGIASPSKVFTQIGSYVMEGMQIGLEDTGEDAIGVVGDIANAMIEEAENGDGLAVQIDATTNGLDAVADKLASIADIFIAITESITEMGGLPLPSIASGQVIPYGAQAAGNASGGATSASATGIEDALYNAITRAQNNSNNDEPVVIKLIVDGREMSDVVTKYQRQQARAWG